MAHIQAGYDENIELDKKGAVKDAAVNCEDSAL